MAKYSGKSAVVGHPIEEIYNKVSNFSSLRDRISQLPPEAQQRLGQVTFGDDRMTINAPGVGELTFAIAERQAPNLLRLTAENSPLPFNIIMHFAAKDENTTEVTTDLDVDIPVMLRPLVGGKLQEAADRFGEMFTNFFGA